MSKGAKTTTTQTGTQSGTQSGASTNTFGYMQPPDTPDIQGLRGFEFQSDPSSPYRTARAHESLHNSYLNPYGAYTTPAIRDAALRTGDMNINQQAGQQSAEDNYNLQGQRYGQRLALAGMTAPQMVQTGGSYSGNSSGMSSGTGTSQQSGGLGQMILQQAIQGGAQAATA